MKDNYHLLRGLLNGNTESIVLRASIVLELLAERDALRSRLEVTPQGPDGIDARDETIRALEADRDSWERQASDRTDDAVQFARERDDARAERDALRADAERASKLIDEHNADCTSQCAGRRIAGKTSCYMVGRMGSCHDCPLDYMIEPPVELAARGMGEAEK